jgi:hypothetical protein
MAQMYYVLSISITIIESIVRISTFRISIVRNDQTVLNLFDHLFDLKMTV